MILVIFTFKFNKKIHFCRLYLYIKKDLLLIIKDKINLLIEILNFKSLKNFADEVIDGNLDRAKGLSSGRIKNLYPHELKKLINEFNINEKWLFGNETNIIKSFDLENSVQKINVYDLNKKVSSSFYFDINLLEIKKDIQNYFLIKSFENLTDKTYFLCKKITNCEFKKNMIVILNYDEQLTIRTIVNITKNSITLSKINTNNEKEKVSKDYLTDSIYAIVEKSINLKIFS